MRRRDWFGLAVMASAGIATPRAWALPPKTLVFPRDFGSHPDLQTEWWYITGQVRAGGRPWGFQLTFFRSRVAQVPPPAASHALQVPVTQTLTQAGLRATHIISAHLAISDVGATLGTRSIDLRELP